MSRVHRLTDDGTEFSSTEPQFLIRSTGTLCGSPSSSRSRRLPTSSVTFSPFSYKEEKETSKVLMVGLELTTVLLVVRGARSLSVYVVVMTASTKHTF